MQGIVNTRAQSASIDPVRRYVNAVAAASVLVTLGVGSIEPAGLGIVGGFGLTTILATPAQARCLWKGAYRTDIADGNDCLEAQRTGCVQHMLRPEQYTTCLADNKRAQMNGETCILGGTIHNEWNAQQCQEAKGTGCIRELLNNAQYVSCLNAQRH
jgi:hypothetical protein